MSAGHNHSQEHDAQAWWVARPENANKVFYGLVVICAGLLLFDLIFFYFNEKHGHFVFERAVAFHGIYGFIAFVFVVVSGKKLRTILMRDEDYYDVPYTPPPDDHHGHGHDDHGQDGHDHGQGHEEQLEHESGHDIGTEAAADNLTSAEQSEGEGD